MRLIGRGGLAAVALGLLLAAAPGIPAAQRLPATREQVAEPGGRIPGSQNLSLVRVVEGFQEPVGVAAAHDGSGRLFVTERAGRIRVVTREGRLLDEPFLDLASHQPGIPYPEVNSGFVEQGLWSVAFHPRFRENGHLFVHYSSMRDNGAGMVVRYTVDRASPDHISFERALATRKVVLHIPQLQFHHNGGMIAFGPDGYLYVGRGDAGWPGAAQRQDQPYGRLLRLNVDVPDDTPYRAPPDNPFVRLLDTGVRATFGALESAGLVGSGAAERRLGWRQLAWAIGMRNPYTFHFDRRSGDLFIVDVGDTGWEEINWQPAQATGGANYGWPANEGAHCFPATGGRPDCAVVGTLPVAQVPHLRPWPESPPLTQNWGCSLIGLGVSTDVASGGAYLAGDWCSGRIWALAWDGGAGRWQLEEIMRIALQPTGGTVDEDGRVVLVNCHCNYGDSPSTPKPLAGLWRFVPASEAPADAMDAASGAPRR